MGKYINKNSKGESLGSTFRDKVNTLILDGANVISEPKTFDEGLVCVVDNGMFAAAAYAYDEREMKHFLSGYSGRNYQWLKYEHAENLTSEHPQINLDNNTLEIKHSGRS